MVKGDTTYNLSCHFSGETDLKWHEKKCFQGPNSSASFPCKLDLQRSGVTVYDEKDTMYNLSCHLRKNWVEKTRWNCSWGKTCDYCSATFVCKHDLKWH